MSFAELKENVARLSAEELAELRDAIDSVSGRPHARQATPEMLAKRREISQKFASGEWSVDLPTYEELKEDAQKNDPWNH